MFFIRINERYVEMPDGLLVTDTDDDASLVAHALEAALPRGRTVTVEDYPDGITDSIFYCYENNLMGHGGYVVASDGIQRVVAAALR